jgi:hypothetical protein
MMVTSTGPHRVCATEPWYVAAAPEVPVAVVVAVAAEPAGAAVVVAEPAGVELVGAVLAVPPLVIIVQVSRYSDPSTWTGACKTARFVRV